MTLLHLLISVHLAAARRVLVTSWGGSGSERIVETLRQAGFGTNSPKNLDKLMFASPQVALRTLEPRNRRLCFMQHETNCYDRIVVVARADPAEAIVSTVSAGALEHFRSLSRGCATCPTMFKGRTKELLIRNVFAAAGRQESDAYGLAAHFGGWLHAANPFHKPRPERRSWPPILIADAATLADPAFQCLLYAFLGLDDPARRYVLSTRLRSLPPLASRRAKHYMDAASLRVYDRLRRHVLGGINASVADANRTYWESSRECRLAPPVARDDDDALVERLFATGRAFERKKGDGDPVDAIPDREWDTMLFDILEPPRDREIN